MQEWLRNFTAQIGALPPGRQLALLVTALGSAAFFAWLIEAAGREEYRALYRGLPEAEVGRIVEVLRAENVDYRLADGGTALLVPASRVYEARIQVASQGLPRGGGAGFELFDRPGFGVTDFVHRVNFVRAIQGELARSIERLDPVEQARVQVVLPERRSVLAAERRRPSAAVVVGLRPGHELQAGQVRAVVHLVASSIEALAPSDVTVVDDQGRLLTASGEAGVGSRPPGGAPAYQAKLEAELAGRVEAILEKTLGPGAVVARVRAELDWTESETTEERFDPDSQVARSERRTSEASADASEIAGGIPGVASNAPGGPGGAASGGAGASANRSEETINYEISKTVSRSVTPMGRIERLSVAVLVAEPEAGDASGDADADAETGGWSEPELERFAELARQAVGFSSKRGDSITVTAAPFRAPEQALDEGGGMGPELWLLIGNLVRGLALLLGLLFFGRFVLRPLLSAVAPPAALGGGLPARVAELEAALDAQGALAAGGVESDRQLGPGAGSGRRDDAVHTIRNWLNQG